MSVEEAVTEALQAPVDQNAQAAEDAKKLLAELESEAVKTAQADTAKTPNETAETQFTEKETSKAIEEQKDRAEKSRDHRRDGRSDNRARGYGRGGHNGYRSRNYRENIKSDLTSQEVTDDPVAIRKQVEFYFSDSNLPRDDFLMREVGGITNNPVALKKIHTFKRMRHFQPFEAIVEALRESTTLQLTDDDTCIQRKTPLNPDDFKATLTEADGRSIYAKGFGDEVPSTQFDIEAFFAAYGPTRAVRLRRSDDKLFKGSVFVEFETEELAKAFLESDPKPQYKGKELQIMSKKTYTDNKTEDLKAGRIISNKKPHQAYNRDYHDRGGRSGRDGKRKRDEEDNRDWRTRRDEDQKRGFKDDKRRGDRGRDSRGGRSGRLKEHDTDDNGIPTVKPSPLKKDTDRDDALAKARAAVEAENEKEEADQRAADSVESTEQDCTADASSKTANIVSESIEEDKEATTGRKRAGVDDDGEAEAEREVKKVDTKD